MTGRVAAGIVLLGLICGPAYGQPTPVYYGSSLQLYNDALQGESWTDTDYYGYYFGYQAKVEASFTRNQSVLEYKTGYDVGYGHASVNFWGTLQQGDATYAVQGSHFQREPACCGDYSGFEWVYHGYSSDSVGYDDPNDPPPQPLVPDIAGLNPTHGVANVSNYIEIYGSNFTPPQGGLSVTLGGQPVTITYQSDNQVNVQYPAQTVGDKTLTVTTANGSKSVTFNIAAGDPTPVVTSVSPSVWPAGQMTYFSVSGTGFGTAPTLTLQCGGGACQGIGSYGITQGTAWDQGFQASVNLAPDAPTQDVTLIVESHGAFGQGFAPQNPQQPNSPQGQAGAQIQGAAQPTLVLTSNGAQISSGQTAWIDETPQMPNIQVHLASASTGQPASGVATYQLTVTHTVTYTDIQGTHTHTDTAAFPNGPPNQVSAGANWSPGISYFLGGDATLTWTYNSGPAQTFTFKIGGKNPSPQAVLNLLSSSPHWFTLKIAKSEHPGGDYKQFSDNSSGTPIFGQPDGWGIMQIDPPGDIQRKWNWQMNVQEGLARLQEKVDGGYAFWRTQVIQWHDWNEQHPPADLRLPPDNVSEASCTFTLSPLNQSPWTQPTAGGGTYWYGDAIAIKRYNGASAPPGTGEPPNYLTWRNGGDFINNPYWHFTFLNAGSGSIPPFNYVNRVCSQ